MVSNLDEIFTIEKIIGLTCFVIGVAYFQFFLKKVDIVDIAKGEDRILQLTEVAAIYWFKIFPILFFGDMFFDIPDTTASRLWMGIDTIFAIITLTHGGVEVSKNINKNKNGYSN